MTAAELLNRDFGSLSELIRAHAAERPGKPALVDARRALTYGELDALLDRIAAALQRDGVGRGHVAAICALSSVEYGAAFLGILRAGGIVAPLAPSATPDSLLGQLQDCGAKVFFLDRSVAEHMAGALERVVARRVALDRSEAGEPLEGWLAPPGASPVEHPVTPEDGFNIIYSSGTTGAPKGIVQPHRMRWGQIRRGGYRDDAVTMISTPLYSNTTLISFLPTVGNGGTAVLMAKFDATEFLELSERTRATHAMLVPVQYRRLMEHPDFDRYDLSSYKLKFATSAPFPAELKRQVLDRWPGGLVEFYGMTEGGATFTLQCHKHPDKLHTVGRPLPGHEVRLIGEDGREVGPGEVGEVVGRSGAMMKGYHNLPDKTSETEWWSPDGLKFLRTGDLGRFDADGFLELMGRRKDMIISGGFNIYPSDLEAELARHPAVAESAVVGVPSREWGETPVAFVVLKAGERIGAEELKVWVNGRVGKTQRLADLKLVDALPRSHIGKVLKAELRESYV